MVTLALVAWTLVVLDVVAGFGGASVKWSYIALVAMALVMPFLVKLALVVLALGMLSPLELTLVVLFLVDPALGALALMNLASTGISYLHDSRKEP